MNGFEPLRRRITDYTVAGQWQEVYDGPIEGCEEFRLKEENAKLRELIHDLIRPPATLCFGCKYEKHHDCECGFKCVLIERTKKLGVEI